MHFSTTTPLLLALATVQSTQAHWFLKCITRPGDACTVAEEGSHMAPYVDNHPENTDWPRTTPCNAATDPRMMCGPSGPPGVEIEAIQVDQGMQLTAWFAHEAKTDNYRPNIHSNHHGYTQVYLAPYATMNEQNTWTKIFTEGFVSNGDDVRALWADTSLNDNQGTQFVGWWATDKLRLNGGKFIFTIPTGTPNGKYVLRSELLTNLLPGTAVPGAQGYVGCVPIQVGSGPDESAQLPSISQTVALPQAYAQEPFVTSYNTFEDLSRNIPPTPGGPAWTGTTAVAPRDLPVLKRSRHFHAHAHLTVV